MQELETSVVHRHLDTKLKIAGIEALDLLVALTISAFMGFFFEGGILGIIFILCVPLLFLSTLVLVKRNKPEGFLKDFIRFTMLRGFYSASSPLSKLENRRMPVTFGGEIE
ncbi:MAG: hypothetical protein QE271_08110 [Bacteriovoracaceae bacterium]|nr:hypothetical protein [Bacteriovoracaceae bacterium]